MRKMIKAMVSMLVLSTAIASNVSAHDFNINNTNSNTKKINAKIEKVYYDKEKKAIYANTVKDSDNGFWVLELSNSKYYFDAFLTPFKTDLEGRRVEVEYSGDLKNYNDVELIDYKIDYSEKSKSK